MADHLRTQIRDAIKSAMIAGCASLSGRVFKGRVYPLDTEELPGALIFGESEINDSNEIGTFPRVIESRYRVTIRLFSEDVADLDDKMDALCMEVQIALAMPCVALADIAKSIDLQSTIINLVRGAEVPNGSAELTYEVFYLSAENAPDVAR